MNYLFTIFIFFTVIFNSCTSGDRIFKDDKLEGDNIQLFIIPSESIEIKNLPDSFNEGIEITNLKAILSFYNQKSLGAQDTIFQISYTGIITDSGKIHTMSYLNKDLTMISTIRGVFKTNPESILSQKEYLIPLRRHMITVFNRETAIKCRETLIKNEVLSLFMGTNPIPEWVQFKGSLTVEWLDTTDYYPSFKELVVKLEKDLSNSIGKFRIGELRSENEKYLIELYCDEFKNELSAEYKIEKKFSLFQNIRIEVVGIDKMPLIQILANNNIEFLKIE